MEKHGIEWEEVNSGTRVTIELEAKYQRGRGSVDDYLEQTAVANPHVTVHYKDPDNNDTHYARVGTTAAQNPKKSSRTPMASSWACWSPCCKRPKPAR